MVIEFYGEVSDYTKVRTDKIRKRYFAGWLFGLAILLLLVTVLLVVFGEGYGWVAPAVFAVILTGNAAYHQFGPMKKSMENKRWLLRVHIEGDEIIYTQYLPQKTIEKKKRLDQIKKVYRTKFCYYLVYNDVANAIVCERSLLKRGTFERLEYLFEGKIKNMDV